MGQENVLVLALYDTEPAADEAVAALTSWSKANKQIKLGGVGVLVKDEFGQIKQQKLGPRQSGKGAGVGMVLGLVAAIPTGGLSLLPGLVSGAVAGGVVGSRFRKGVHELSKDDTERIDRELTAGHAVVGVLVEPIDAHAVTAVLVKHGGTVEEHVISDEALKDAAKMTGPTAQSAMPPEPGESTSPQA
jgi:hypothetical protein